MYFSGDERNLTQAIPHLEALEDRLYLTTLVGGEVFEYAIGQHQYRVVLEGDIVVELVESDLITGEITDMSGIIVSGPRGGTLINGGLDELESIELIGSLLEDTDSIYGILENEFDIDAIASDDVGSTVNMNDGTPTFGLRYDENANDILLYGIDNLTGEVYNPTDPTNLSGAQTSSRGLSLGGSLVFPHDPDTGELMVEYSAGQIGADFLPDISAPINSGPNNYLYFTLGVEEDDAQITKLYRIDPYDANPIGTLQDMGIFLDGDAQVNSIAWDQVSDTEAYLVAVIEMPLPGGGTEQRVVQYSSDRVWAAAGPSPTVPIVMTDSWLLTQDVSIDELTGLEFVYPSPGAPETLMYTVIDDQLYTIELSVNPVTNGNIATVSPLGILEDVDGPPSASGAERGKNIQGLAWNPLILNPYTGTIGALIGTDVSTDELVIIDYSLRTRAINSDDVEYFSPSLFNIFIVESSDNARIAVSVLEDPTSPLPIDMLPFAGSIGDFLYMNAQSGQTGTDITLSAPEAGMVLLGVTGSLIGADNSTFIYTSGTHSEQIGNLPQYYDNNPEVNPIDPEQQSTLYSGIIMTENILEMLTDTALENAMLQLNIDRIAAMAASVTTVDSNGDNYVYVIDNDHVDAYGDTIASSQLIRIDPETGRVHPDYYVPFAFIGNGAGGILYDGNGDPITFSGYINPVNITDSVTGAPVTVVDMDYGDIDMDGTEELFAIATYEFTTEDPFATDFGIIDPLTGEFTSLGAIPGVSLINQVGGKSMAVSPGPVSFDGKQSVFVSMTDGNLYEIELDDANLDGDTDTIVPGSVAYPAMAYWQDADGNNGNNDGDSYEDLVATGFKSMDFDKNGNLFGYDQEFGRFMDIIVGVTYVQFSTGNDIYACGMNTLTAPGSLRPMVGAITYDFHTGDFLVADNTYGYQHRKGEEQALEVWYDSTGGLGTMTPAHDGLTDRDTLGVVFVNPVVDFGGNPILGPDGNPVQYLGAEGGTDRDGSIIMRLRGTDTEDAAPQAIDRIMIGGVVGGKVDIAGSVDMFYAGWIITGDSRGDMAPNMSLGSYNAVNADNFHVDGDLRNLITIADVGMLSDTDSDDGLYISDYETRVEISVGGKLGWFGALNGSSMGVKLDVFNSTPEGDLDNTNSGYLNYQYEVEKVLTDAQIGGHDSAGWAFENYGLMSSLFSNDSYFTPQHLGSIRQGAAGEEDLIRVRGALVTAADDDVDYYAVSLQAGQTISVQLVDMSGAIVTPFHLLVMDPDWMYDTNVVLNGLLGLGQTGKIIASDFSDTDPGAVEGQEFQFTADKAGVYRFAVVGANLLGILNYELRISGVGDMAIGAVTAGDIVTDLGIIRDCGEEPFIYVETGDIGAISAGHCIQTWFGGSTGSYSIFVADGNMRSVSANLFDRRPESDSVYPSPEFFPYFYVPNGNIGALRTFSAEDQMYFLADLGGDIQNIYCAGMFWAIINAGGGLGQLHAGNMEMELDPVIINLNTDRTGNDGIIDYWEVVNNMGPSATVGGPQIDTGPGGNVRYMTVGGTFFQSVLFTQSWPAYVYEGFVETGETFVFEDDGGATLRLTVESRYFDTLYGSPLTTPSLRYRIFGVGSETSGTGGGVLVDVTTVGNLIIESDSHGGKMAAEIGTINMPQGIQVDENGDPLVLDSLPQYVQDAYNSVGRQVVMDDITGELSLGDYVGCNIFLRIEGGYNNPVDVYKVTGTNFTSISNLTVGEMVNIEADSIGVLYTEGTVGYARKGEFNQAVYQYAVISDDTPFSQLHNAVVVNTNILEVVSYGGIGNFAVTGSIDSIRVNPDGIVDHSDNDSIEVRKSGPVSLYRGIVGAVRANVDIRYVNIGEGIATAGTGEAMQAGLFAGNRIGLVTNEGQQVGSNIYGDIIAIGGVAQIDLYNGCLINADIASIGSSSKTTNNNGIVTAVTLVPETFWYGWEWFNRSYPADYDYPTTNWASIGTVSVRGSQSGIIGTRISASDFRVLEVVDGFGLFNSYISTYVGNDDIGTITVDGFGIYNTFISAGDDIDRVTITGNGHAARLGDYNYNVRYSEAGAYEYEPLFGMRVNELNDIHKILGTLLADDTSTMGMMANTQIQGQGSINRVRAYQIITNDNTRSLTSKVDFINQIHEIITVDDIDGFEMSAGKLGRFRPGNNVYGLDLNVSGKIGDIKILGDLADNSVIEASGPNGYINSVTVNGSMQGYIISNGRVGTIDIGGDFSGMISVDVTNDRIDALSKLVVGGTFAQGALDVNGSVGYIEIMGDFGIDEDWLEISGDLGILKVGTNKNVDGSTMFADLAVEGDVNLIDITGQLKGDIYVGGSLGNVIVRADDATENGIIVDSDIDVRGTLGKAQIINGSFAGHLVAGLSIGSFILSGENQNLGGTVSSTYGDIGLVDVRNGNLTGSIGAYNGDINTIRINGDMAATARIWAESLNKFDLSGSMIAGADASVTEIDIAGIISSFLVRGEVTTGWNIAGVSGGKFTIGDDFAGSLDLAWADKASTIRVDGDLTGGVSVWTSAAVIVGGDMSGMLFVDADLTALAVSGTYSGDLSINKSAGNIKFGSMAGGAASVGFDVKSILIAGAMENSLIQIGMSIGDDSAWTTDDAYEVSRVASLGSIKAASMTNSIVAATGDISKAQLTVGMTSSSISAGLNLGSEAIDAVVNDATPLADALELAAARSGTDRELYAGDIINASVGLGGMVTSSITAGVDAGVDGDFATAADNNVTSSITGGQSIIKSLKADVNAGSVAIADSGVLKHNGAAIGDVGSVDYAITDIAPEAVVGNLQGTATHGNDATFVTNSGFIYTISVRGAGAVSIYDEAGGDTDDIIDLITIAGTQKNTRITISGNNVDGAQISRIVGEDDASIGQLEINGDLIGDGTAATDLWIDGDIGKLNVVSMGGEGWSGSVGGDVASLAIVDQQPGSLNIGGQVKKLEIAGGDSNSIFGGGTAFDSANVGLIALNELAGWLYAWDSTTNELYYVNDYANRQVVQDLFGNNLVLKAMDFGDASQLFAIAEANNPIPNIDLPDADLSSASYVDLTYVADNASLGSDAIFGIASGFDGDNGIEDYLFRIDPVTGEQTTIGALAYFGHSFNGQVMTLAYDSSNSRLLALVSDQNGTAAGGNPGVAIIEVDLADYDGDGYVDVTRPGTTNSLGMLLDDGLGNPVLSDFATMAVADNGTVYAIRGTNELVTINMASGVVTTIGDVEFDTGHPLDPVSIAGMEFDDNDNLIAYTGDVAAEMIKINTALPGSSSRVTVEDSLEGGITGFTVGGGNTFACKLVGGESVFMTSAGQTQSPVVINIGSGEALFMPALTDADGELLTDEVTGLAVNVFDAAADLYVSTEAGELLVYDHDTSLHKQTLNISIGGRDCTLADLDFNNDNGDLIGLDVNTGQFVLVDAVTGIAVGKTLAGVVNTDEIRSFAVHSTTDQVIVLDSTTNEHLASRTGLDMASEGISAESVVQVQIDSGLSGYSGYISSNAGDIKKVTIKNDFSGLVYADGDISNVQMSSGNFYGSVTAEDMLGSFTLKNGNAMPGSSISGSEIRKINIAGEFLGSVSARTGGKFVFAGDASTDGPFSAADYADAYVSVSEYVASISFAGDFYGEIDVNEAGKIDVGALLNDAEISAYSDVSNIRVAGSVETAAMILSLGGINSLFIGGTLGGLLASARGMNKAVVAAMDEAIVTIAQDTNSFIIGDMRDSVLSFGTWIGSDLMYNTADDLIVGGSVNTVKITSRMRDSAIVAGVLPNIDADSDSRNIPDDNRLYIGRPGSTNMMVNDSAEAGGIFDSTIGKLIINDVVNTSFYSGRVSVAAAADGIGSVKIATRGATLSTREYSDPYGAVSVESTEFVTDNILKIYFSEELNTSTLILSVDVDGNGELDSTEDIIGSISIYESIGGINNYLDGITMEYEYYTADNGTVKSVVTLTRLDGFSADLVFEMSLGEYKIYDRSGLRSVMRYFNGEPGQDDYKDPAGTILDGDNDRVEGTEIIQRIVSGDTNPNHYTYNYHTDIYVEIDAQPDGPIHNVTSLLTASDYDYYVFYADQWEFFSIDYASEVNSSVLICYLDETAVAAVAPPDIPTYHDEQYVKDDFSSPLSASVGVWKALARHESGYSVFEAFEAPQAGYYGIFIGNDTSAAGTYSFDLRVASSDDMLDGLNDNQVALPEGEEIAYISNTVNEHNNELGANTPTQLVYLNFNGGTTTEYTDMMGSEYNVLPFDISCLNNAFEGFEDDIIYGNAALGITGIVDRILAIYENTVTDLKLVYQFFDAYVDLSFNVGTVSSLAEWQAVTSGIYFTTEDPSTWGDADLEYTTMFIGETPAASYGLFGMASTIDVAGQDKSDEAIIAVQNFIYYEDSGYIEGTTYELLDSYAALISTTIAHELGHTLGWNHQFQNSSTDPYVPANSYVLYDNWPDSRLTPGSNEIYEIYDNALMSYPDRSLEVHFESGLGTAIIALGEFNVPNIFIDTAMLAYWWFS